MIGSLQCLVELGRIDIITEVSYLSSHNVSPCSGHLKAAYKIFKTCTVTVNEDKLYLMSQNQMLSRQNSSLSIGS